MSPRQARGFGDQNKPLDELSDQELLQEVQRRRRKRGVAAEEPPEAAPQGTQMAQYLANLELKAGATLEEVEAAYARLRAKYRPFLQADSPERRAAARRLLDSLEQAYEGVNKSLGKR